MNRNRRFTLKIGFVDLEISSVVGSDFRFSLEWIYRICIVYMCRWQLLFVLPHLCTQRTCAFLFHFSMFFPLVIFIFLVTEYQMDLVNMLHIQYNTIHIYSTHRVPSLSLYLSLLRAYFPFLYANSISLCLLWFGCLFSFTSFRFSDLFLFFHFHQTWTARVCRKHNLIGLQQSALQTTPAYASLNYYYYSWFALFGLMGGQQMSNICFI